MRAVTLSTYLAFTPASKDGALELPSRTTLDAGGRLRFDLLKLSTTLRLQVQNITDSRGWSVGLSPGLLRGSATTTASVPYRHYLKGPHSVAGQLPVYGANVSHTLCVECGSMQQCAIHDRAELCAYLAPPCGRSVHVLSHGDDDDVFLGVDPEGCIRSAAPVERAFRAH